MQDLFAVEQLRRLRAQVKRRGVHHDFSWQKDEEAEYLSTSGSTTNELSIEVGMARLCTAVCSLMLFSGFVLLPVCYTVYFFSPCTAAVCCGTRFAAPCVDEQTVVNAL